MVKVILHVPFVRKTQVIFSDSRIHALYRMTYPNTKTGVDNIPIGALELGPLVRGNLFKNFVE